MWSWGSNLGQPHARQVPYTVDPPTLILIQSHHWPFCYCEGTDPESMSSWHSWHVPWMPRTTWPRFFALGFKKNLAVSSRSEGEDFSYDDLWSSWLPVTAKKDFQARCRAWCHFSLEPLRQNYHHRGYKFLIDFIDLRAKTRQHLVH